MAKKHKVSSPNPESFSASSSVSPSSSFSASSSSDELKTQVDLLQKTIQHLAAQLIPNIPAKDLTPSILQCLIDNKQQEFESLKLYMQGHAKEQLLTVPALGTTGTELCVLNLPLGTLRTHVLEHFAQYALCGIKTFPAKKMAFVGFTTPKDAQDAKQTLHLSCLKDFPDSNPIRIGWSRKNTFSAEDRRAWLHQRDQEKKKLHELQDLHPPQVKYLHIIS